jgi:probable phosphoglycerate mutase
VAGLLVVEADGGSRGNPGPAGYGALVRSEGVIVAERGESIGTATNNVAEYRGLIAGLEAALELDPSAEVEVRMDSKLVVEQMSGRWKIKHPDMRPLAIEAQALARQFPRISYQWVPREQNKDADRLANEAMDRAAMTSGGPTRTPSAEPVESLVSPTGGGTREGAGSAATSGTPVAGWRPPAGIPTRLLLLRHGQTPLSIEKRYSGLGDPQLTPEGERQAAAAARRLRSYDIGAIVSSPLGRARRTAEIVAAEVGRQVQVDEDLREVDFGEWEGLTFAEVRKKWPNEMAAWLADPAVAPPGGESFLDAQQRVIAARERTLATYPEDTVLLVSHVTPIKLLVQLALEAPLAALYRMHLDLASLTTVDAYADGPAVLRVFNDTAHLVSG